MIADTPPIQHATHGIATAVLMTAYRGGHATAPKLRIVGQKAKRHLIVECLAPTARPADGSQAPTAKPAEPGVIAAAPLACHARTEARP